MPKPEDEYGPADVSDFNPALSGEKVVASDIENIKQQGAIVQQSIDKLEGQQIDARIALDVANQILEAGNTILGIVDRIVAAQNLATGGALTNSGLAGKISQATAAIAGVQGLITTAKPLLGLAGIKIP